MYNSSYKYDNNSSFFETFLIASLRLTLSIQLAFSQEKSIVEVAGEVIRLAMAGQCYDAWPKQFTDDVTIG